MVAGTISLYKHFLARHKFTCGIFFLFCFFFFFFLFTFLLFFLIFNSLWGGEEEPSVKAARNRFVCVYFFFWSWQDRKNLEWEYTLKWKSNLLAVFSQRCASDSKIGFFLFALLSLLLTDFLKKLIWFFTQNFNFFWLKNQLGSKSVTKLEELRAMLSSLMSR